MTRNTKGIICWSALDVVLTAVSLLIFGDYGSKVIVYPFFICFIAMFAREEYQSSKTGVMEWFDVVQYGFTLLATSVITGFVLVLAGIIE